MRTSSAELRQLAEAVESARLAVEIESGTHGDDAPGSLAVALMDLRVARNALSIAADRVDYYCAQYRGIASAAAPAVGPAPPSNPSAPVRLWAHMRGAV